ncbi:MAG: DUF4230 domain-containing protein [Lachnospiraceae bacterium]|nr:DUF4230 domain-containing protein [Lachnospiraceae bacterium]
MEEKRKRRRPFWLFRKIKSFFAMIGFLVVLAVCLYFGWSYAVSTGMAGSLFGGLIQEQVEVINVQIESRLNAIGELATYSYEYRNEKSVTDTREIFGTAIPGTTNQIDMIYSGVIKVGYEIGDISYEVDWYRKKIHVMLPKIQVLDNYIKLDDLQCREKNNILNPIGTEEMTAYFEEIEAEELARAKEQGIEKKAEERFQEIMKAFLAELNDYEVVFEQQENEGE